MASTTQRGYGAAHQRARAQALAQLRVRPGRCCLCGKTIRFGDDVHLDHTPDRTGYRGLACATCNTSDGGKRRWEGKSRAKPGSRAQPASGGSYPIARAE